MGPPRHPCDQRCLLLQLRAEQAATGAPAGKKWLQPLSQVPPQATAALAAAKEVNSGLAALWDAGAGRAWSWETVLTGQKLVEMSL